MSQYPPPHSPQQPPYFGSPSPQPPGESPDDLLAPARRAGVLMIVIGALAVLCGLYVAWQSRNIDSGELYATPELQRQMQQNIDLFESQTGMAFRTLMLVMAFVPLAVGAVLGAMGFYVRGGSFGFIVASSILTGLMLLATGAGLVLGALQGAMMGGPLVASAAVCQCGVPFALLSVLMYWLVRAMRGASRLALAHRNYQAQLWQYQQYQQAYLQNPPPQQAPPTGMGYSHPPQAPPSPETPPPQMPAPMTGLPPERKDPTDSPSDDK